MPIAKRLLHIKVVPRAQADSVQRGEPPVDYLVRTTAVPDKGRANQAVIVLLAKALALPKTALRIVRGQTSRHKIVEVDA